MALLIRPIFRRRIELRHAQGKVCLRELAREVVGVLCDRRA